MRAAFRSFLIALAMGGALPITQAQADSTVIASADPARVAAARPVVDKLFPVGTYRRMMGGTMSKMMDSMIGGVMKMPIAQIARISGVPADKLTGMSEASLEEVSTIVDPHFRERTKLGMDAMMGGMTDLMDGFEPNVRGALTRAYARKFDVRQLGEINAFFATPTGNRFASDYMSMMMDPDIMSEMQALMPEMMKKIPDMAEKAKKATESLPPPRKASDLSDAEKTKLAQLLGIKSSDLKDSAAQPAEGTE
ncbi:DUF2059 domain-containing protein [Sphingobium aromaticiconvertens]|uniref:DUF2059 domain-containing protein n=1 Tax=Sphingobium aromaticiconvertens TaxID=365341 RepID=UPI003015E78F